LGKKPIGIPRMGKINEIKGDDRYGAMKRKAEDIEGWRDYVPTRNCRKAEN
jgi:hypothetical protein